MPDTETTPLPSAPSTEAPPKPPAARKRRLYFAAAVVLVSLPAILLFLLIRQHRVNFPFLDDWMFVHMFKKEAEGTLTIWDFFSAQMEHRMAFVRGVIMLFHHWWPTDWTMQMFFCWLLLVLTQVNVGILIKRTTGRPFLKWWPLLLLAAITLFSPVQYRIILWAMMFQVACPAFFLTGTLVALTSPWPLWLRWTVGVLCASCATQCFASGLLVWVLPLPLIWWGGGIRKPVARHIFGGLWLLAFGITLGLYFHGLKNEADPAFAYKQQIGDETLKSDMSGVLSQPERFVPYVLRFLGCHLGRGSSMPVMDASLLAGVASTVLYLGALAYLIVHWKREDLRARLLPWLALGAYSPLTGAMVAMGRMWASTSGENAIAPRYVIHAVPLTISLIMLVWLIVKDWQKRQPGPVGFVNRSMLAAGVVLTCVQAISWLHGRRLMEMWESSRLRGAVATRFVGLMEDMPEMVPLNKHYAFLADSLGLLKPPLLQDAKLNNFRLAPKLLSSNTARLKDIEIGVDDAGYYGIAEGYACLASRSRVADGVFLTRRVPREGWEIIQVAQVAGLPLFLIDSLSKDTQFVHIPGEHVGQEGLSGFASRFRLDRLPPGVHDIMAWAYDARRNAVYPMAGFFELDTRGPRPRLKRLGTKPSSVHLDRFLEGGAKPAPEEK